MINKYWLWNWKFGGEILVVEKLRWWTFSVVKNVLVKNSVVKNLVGEKFSMWKFSVVKSAVGEKDGSEMRHAIFSSHMLFSTLLSWILENSWHSKFIHEYFPNKYLSTIVNFVANKHVYKLSADFGKFSAFFLHFSALFRNNPSVIWLFRFFFRLR